MTPTIRINGTEYPREHAGQSIDDFLHALAASHPQMELPDAINAWKRFCQPTTVQ